MKGICFYPRRLLWVDAQPSTLVQTGHFLRAHQLNVRFVDNFEDAQEEIGTWIPHLLLLDYITPGGVAYETFVHDRLPLIDPYQANGPMTDNPWQHTAIPILLVAGEPMASTPGLKAPHLHRAAHFVPKPFEPSCLVALVDKLLPEPDPEIIINPNQNRVEMEGNRHTVTERGLNVLVTLARHHPRPLTAAQLARHMHKERGVRTSESSVRMTVQILRRQLKVDDARTLVANERGYVLTLTPTLISD